MDDVVRAFLENEQKLRLVKRIGRGGFGEVWEAESESGVRSAIKVSLDPIDDQNPAVKKELENLKLVKSLTGHPHIVSLLDYWVVSGYLVTRWELATDGSLEDILKRYQQEGHPGIPLKQLIKWIHEAAEGLDFLHEKGIYHRDIKPQNLLLFHGHVKLGDLGLVKLVGASTASHTGSGTFGYLPPEAWEEHRLTRSVDLYSLAATYIKLRTGQEPFGTNPVEIVERQRAGRPVLEGLQPGEANLVRQALAPRPEDRPRDGAAAWVRSLYRALRGEGRSGAGVTSERPAAGTSQATVLEPAPESRVVVAELVGVRNWAESVPAAGPPTPPPSPALEGGMAGRFSDQPNEFIKNLIGALNIPGVEALRYRNRRTKNLFGSIIAGAIDGGIYVGIGGAVLGVIFGVIGGASSGDIVLAIGGAIGGAILGAIGGAIYGAIRGAVVGAIEWLSDWAK